MNKKQKKNFFVAIVLTASLAGYLVFKPTEQSSEQSQKSSTFGPSKAPETFHGFPREGVGGDPALNRQKNRWSPPDSISDYSILQLFAFPHNDLEASGKRRRHNWSASAITEAATYERLGVRVEGYLIAAKQMGPETCNGKSDSLRDFHIWIGVTPEDKKADALVVEMTPYYKELHPEWRLRYLQALSERHSKVRVTGWVLWDQEHGDEVGKSRGSQWEVHPVTRFEVYSGNAWTDLRGEISER